MSVAKHNVDTQIFAELVDVAGCVVVDVGSGSAGFVAWLNERGATAFGIECSQYMLNQSKLTFDRPHQICGVGQQLPIATDSVSVVTFMNSLHHVPPAQMETALREACRIVEPDGRVYVLEPVAEGPGFETNKIIDDESEVRALAQDAMDRLSTFELSPLDEGRYINRYIYRDLDEYFEMMIGVDQSRAELVDKHRDRVSVAFHRYGTPTPQGTAFDHPMHYRLFAVG